jgi:hypothetical protein
MSQSFRDLDSIDLAQPLAFAVLAVAFFALRLPWIGYGHGTDPDAWRVALTAHHLLETGDYFPSRLPGNPLHEFVTTLLIPGGWIATNLGTAVVSLVGVYVFARIVKLHDMPNPAVLVLGFAFTPLLLINSIATMDYMWTLTAILGAYYCAQAGRSLWAGILIGVAMGFRFQGAIVWLPLAFLLWRSGRKADVAPMTAAAAGVALLVYSPVLVVYGLDFFNYYDASVGYEDVLRLLGKEALGIIGGLGVLAGIAISLPRLRAIPADLRTDPAVGTWVLFIGVYFISFARLPHEIAYLIPVFPFGYLLMGRYLTRAGLAVAISAIFVAGAIDITTPGTDINLTDATIGKGLVLSNADTMSLQRNFVEEVIDADVPDGSVVMTGFVYPQLAVRERDRLDVGILQRDYGAISMLSDRGEAVDRDRDVRYVWLLTYETFEALRSQGYSMFMVPDAAGSTVALYDYRPGIFGATFLALEQAAPSIASGTSDTDR